MSVDSIRFILLQELRHHHVGAANAISREALFDYVQSCFPDQEDDRDMRQAIAESPEICWSAKTKGYFIAAEKGEVEKRLKTLRSYRDSLSVHISKTERAYPDFYNPGEQGKLDI
jgi:hypothetical protein